LEAGSLREFRGPGAKEKVEKNLRGLDINYVKLLLIYFVRAPNLEELVPPRLGPLDPGGKLPRPISAALIGRWLKNNNCRTPYTICKKEPI